jgi:hypothetical protein
MQNTISWGRSPSFGRIEASRTRAPFPALPGSTVVVACGVGSSGQLYVLLIVFGVVDDPEKEM